MLECNSVNKINYISKPAFKAENVTKPEEKPQEKPIPIKKNSLDILAIYNSPLVKNIDKKELEPSPIIDIPFENPDLIEGEKIYTSDGKLHSIVKKDGKNETTYYVNQDTNKVEKIEIKDKKSGKLVKTQEYNYGDDELDEIYIRDFNKNGESEKSSCYDKLGKPIFVCKDTIDNYGRKTTLSHDFGYQYGVSAYDEKRKENVRINMKENKEITSMHSHRETPKGDQDIRVDFYNGSPINIRKTVETTLPNFIGETLKTEEFEPAPKFEFDEGLADLEGEKTYYSNGAIESNKTNINGENAVVSFEPNGNISKVDFGAKKIYNYKFYQKIEEQLDNDTTKTTGYYKDGGYFVTVGNDKNYKELDINKNGNISQYEEVSTDENGRANHRAMYFNENGFLNDVYEYIDE